MAKKKETLTKDNQAKLAAGIPLGEIGTPDDKSPKKVDASNGVDTDDEAEAKAKLEAEVEAEAKNKLEEQGSTTELTTFLKDQNKDLNTDNAAMKLELSQVKAELATLQSGTDGLEKIVVEACNRISVPMGQAGTDYSHMKGNSLVEAYGNLNTEFCKRFPVGGKVKIEAEPEQDVNQSTNRAKVVSAAKI